MFTVKFKGCPQVAVSSQILRLRVDSGRARRFDAPFTPGLLRRSNSRAAAVTGRARTGKGRWRSRPISRVLSWTVIPLGATSPLRSSSLPGPDAGRVMRSLFGLAPGGVCRAGLLPGSRCALTAPFHPCLIPRHPAAAFPEGTWPMLRIVRSPDWGRTGVARAIGGIFLLHFPSARAAQALPGTVPCGARTFLGIVSDDATVWPAPPSAILRLSPPSIGESRDQVQLFETWSLDSGWGCRCRGNSIRFGPGPPLQGQKLRFGRGRRCKGISSAAWFRVLLQHAGAVHPGSTQTRPARTKSPCSDVLRDHGVLCFGGRCLQPSGAGIDEATDIQVAKDAAVRGSGASRPWMACVRLLEPGTAQPGDAPDPRTAAAPPEGENSSALRPHCRGSPRSQWAPARFSLVREGITQSGEGPEERAGLPRPFVDCCDLPAIRTCSARRPARNGRTAPFPAPGRARPGSGSGCHC